ncbi:hypothetical protein M0R04_10240 [Candidatus Dojkabacteria bacterium]|jgi:hypothetical protein|nr:hypothetical protein [Candidatus Dojkabacteria bacterium]
MQQSVGRIISADNEYPLLVNGELETVGPVVKVRGYALKGTQVLNNYQILGLTGGYKTDGTTKLIAVADGASNSDAYTYNPATNVWTPHQLSLSTGSKAEFEYFLDGFFMVNFTEATRFNDYAQWYTTTNVTSAPKAKYIKHYLSRLYLGYVVDGASTYGSRVIYSELPNDASPQTISWNNATNFIDVAIDDGDVIKGLSVNSNRLLIFKENSLYRYDTNTLYKVPGAPGTVSHRSIQELQGVTLYLNSSGIWLYDGSTSKLISRKIKEVIEGISTKNLSDSNSYTRGDHYYVYVGDVNNTSTGLTINKCLIDYDISKNACSVRSLAHNPTVFVSYRDARSAITYNDATLTYNNAETTYNGLIDSADRIFFGDDDGNVFQQDTTNSFSGTDISFTLETKDYYLGYPASFKLFQKVIVFVNGIKSCTIQFKLDDGDWKTLGKIKETQTELSFPSGSRGKRIKFRILESSSADRFVLEGLDIYCTPEGLI